MGKGTQSSYSKKKYSVYKENKKENKELKTKKGPRNIEHKLRIIEVFFISIASLCVSISSCRTASLEYKLNLENSKLHLKVYCETIDTDEDEKLDTNILRAKYADGIYEDFVMNCYSVITFTYYDYATFKQKTIDVLVPSYFFVGYEGEESDDIYTMIYTNNWKRYWDVSQYVLLDQTDYEAYTDLTHYVIISYKNIIGKTETIGYKCVNGGKFNNVDPRLITEYIEGIDDISKIDIDNLTPDNFMKKYVT